MDSEAPKPQLPRASTPSKKYRRFRPPSHFWSPPVAYSIRSTLRPSYSLKSAPSLADLVGMSVEVEEPVQLRARDSGRIQVGELAQYQVAARETLERSVEVEPLRAIQGRKRLTPLGVDVLTSHVTRNHVRQCRSQIANRRPALATKMRLKKQPPNPGANSRSRGLLIHRNGVVENRAVLASTASSARHPALRINKLLGQPLGHIRLRWIYGHKRPALQVDDDHVAEVLAVFTQDLRPDGLPQIRIAKLVPLEEVEQTAVIRRDRRDVAAAVAGRHQWSEHGVEQVVRRLSLV